MNVSGSSQDPPDKAYWLLMFDPVFLGSSLKCFPCDPVLLARHDSDSNMCTASTVIGFSQALMGRKEQGKWHCSVAVKA